MIRHQIAFATSGGSAAARGIALGLLTDCMNDDWDETEFAQNLANVALAQGPEVEQEVIGLLKDIQARYQKLSRTDDWSREPQSLSELVSARELRSKRFAGCPPGRNVTRAAFID